MATTVPITGLYANVLQIAGSRFTGVSPTLAAPARPTQPPLSMYVGEDTEFDLTVFQADGVTPQNIAGWFIRGVVHAWNDPNTVYVVHMLVLTDPTNGMAKLTVVAADTASLDPGSYQLRIERTNGGFNTVLTLVPLTLLQG